LGLFVNGAAVAEIAPETLNDPVTGSFPSLPWVIELRSPSGRPLLSVTVPSADGRMDLHPIAALSCGLIEMAIVGNLPVSEPAFSGPPGPSPCD
jgi:hypothetical protein